MAWIASTLACVVFGWLVSSIVKHRDKVIAEKREQELRALQERLDSMVEKHIRIAASDIKREMNSLFEERKK